MLSFQEDDFINSKKEGEARWVVTLSDDTTVYQDDDRPNVEPSSAWLRLKAYCEKNNLYIKNMYLQFRSHFESIEPNALGYFFTKSILGLFGSDKNIHYYVVGVVKNGQVHCKKWRLPELIVESKDVREIKDCEKSLIWESVYSTRDNGRNKNK